MPLRGKQSRQYWGLCTRCFRVGLLFKKSDYLKKSECCDSAMTLAAKRPDWAGDSSENICSVCIMPLHNGQCMRCSFDRCNSKHDWFVLAEGNKNAAAGAATRPRIYACRRCKFAAIPEQKWIYALRKP